MAAKQPGFWFSDFVFEKGRVRVPTTTGDMALDWLLITDALRWFTYYLMVRAGGWWNAWRKPSRLKIWFTPAPPRPWYIIWAATVWAGIGFAKEQQGADAILYFEDQTCAAPAFPAGLRVLNGKCPDVSKSTVARVFEESFGYPLALDPMTWQGDAVEKGELNGVHDGRLVRCPTARLPGKTYQRLIDTAEDDGMVCDLRTATVAGKPILVFVKRKPAEGRFSIQNKTVVVRAPEQIFSPAEIEQISRFCAAMNLDWGGLDILRERGTRKLYVVDVNKTDTGPAVILSWKDRVRVTTLLANALTDLVRATKAS